MQTQYFIPFLTKHIDLHSGDDGDSMEAPIDHHPINQTPRPCAWLKLQDIIQVVPIGISSSYRCKTCQTIL